MKGEKWQKERHMLCYGNESLSPTRPRDLATDFPSLLCPSCPNIAGV